jgi:DNA-binding transcriptional ArsR family regulator
MVTHDMTTRQSGALLHRREAVFRAIADPTRREILGLLRAGRRSVGEIAENFRTSRPAISRHLRVLRTAGLVVARRDGTARICELNAAPLRAVDDWLRDYQAFWRASLRNLKRHVEKNDVERNLEEKP